MFIRDVNGKDRFTLDIPMAIKRKKTITRLTIDVAH